MTDEEAAFLRLARAYQEADTEWHALADEQSSEEAFSVATQRQRQTRRALLEAARGLPEGQEG